MQNNKKGPLIIITIILLAIGLYFFAKSNPNFFEVKDSSSSIENLDPQNSINPNIEPQPTENNTGVIMGLVTISPACPGPEHNPPNPQCAPKPYQTDISVSNSNSEQVSKTYHSSSDGKFSVVLPPGTYQIQPAGGARFPSCPTITVKVRANETTTANIDCDSGIR